MSTEGRSMLAVNAKVLAFASTINIVIIATNAEAVVHASMDVDIAV